MFPPPVSIGNHLCCGLVGAVILGTCNHFEGMSASRALCEHTAKVEKHTLWFNRGMCPTLGPRGKKSFDHNHAGTYVGSFKIVTCRENAFGTYDTHVHCMFQSCRFRSFLPTRWWTVVAPHMLCQPIPHPLIMEHKHSIQSQNLCQKNQARILPLVSSNKEHHNFETGTILGTNNPVTLLCTLPALCYIWLWCGYHMIMPQHI